MADILDQMEELGFTKGAGGGDAVPLYTIHDDVMIELTKRPTPV